MFVSVYLIYECMRGEESDFRQRPGLTKKERERGGEEERERERERGEKRERERREREREREQAVELYFLVPVEGGDRCTMESSHFCHAIYTDG